MPNVIEVIKDVDDNVVRRRVRFFCEGQSLTKQSMKAECDINGIMKRFERTGLISHVVAREAYFANVSEVPDFAQAVAVVRDAENMFMSLPAKLRARFDNDAAKYVQFCGDPANYQEMMDLGLRDKPKVVEPLEVKVVNPVAPSA